MADAMRQLRPFVRDTLQLPPSVRAKMLRELAGDEAMEILATGGVDELKRWVESSARNVKAP